MQTTPSVGSWTAAFSPQTSCACSNASPGCHTLYRGRVVSVNANGWQATLEFEKANGTAINAGTQYWVVVGSASNSCEDLNYFIVRKAGSVASTGSTFTVNDVPIWADASSYQADPVGTIKYVFLVTDGTGVTGQKVWFQKDPIAFSKACN